MTNPSESGKRDCDADCCLAPECSPSFCPEGCAYEAPTPERLSQLSTAAQELTDELIGSIPAGVPVAQPCRECGGLGYIESDSSLNTRRRPCRACSPPAPARPEERK
jgi:hypothetical protein